MGILTFKMPFGNMNGMKTKLAIDGAGRMVLPKAIRSQFKLHSGSELELEIGHDSITLYPVDMGEHLKMEKGLYVHEGEPADLLLDAVSMDREERARAVWGHK